MGVTDVLLGLLTLLLLFLLFGPALEYLWMTKVRGAIPIYDDQGDQEEDQNFLPAGTTDKELQAEVIRRSFKSGNIVVANVQEDGRFKIEEFPE